MKNNKIISNKESVSINGLNENTEDFAESVAEMTISPKKFQMEFPNKAKIIRDLIGF